MKPIKVLATNSKNNCSYWKENVCLYEEYLKDLSPRWRTKKADSILFNIKWAIKLFRKSREYDVIVTNAEKCFLLFSIFQLVFRRNPKHHILLFALWNISDKGFRKYIQLFKYKIILKAISKVIVFSYKQQALHANAFNESQNKFPVVYYHLTLPFYPSELCTGDYLFSGGDTGRDYKTLIEAVRGLSCKVVIAALQRYHFDGIDIPGNVIITTVNSEEFIRLLAGCKAMILPLFGRKLQAGGQQTFLNAMALGKTVIVADDNGADEYINNGVDGIIIQPENVSEMRVAISSVMNNFEFCKTIGINAKIKAQMYPVDRFSRDVYSISRDLILDSDNKQDFCN